MLNRRQYSANITLFAPGNQNIHLACFIAVSRVEPAISLRCSCINEREINNPTETEERVKTSSSQKKKDKSLMMVGITIDFAHN